MAYRAMSLECSGNSEEAIVPKCRGQGEAPVKLERLAGWFLQGSAGHTKSSQYRTDE